MTSDRIEELMKQTAYPESNSVLQAMNQVLNEMQQDFNSRTCDNCKWDNSWDVMASCSLIGYTRYRDFGCNQFVRKAIKDKK